MWGWLLWCSVNCAELLKGPLGCIHLVLCAFLALNCTDLELDCN